MNHSEYIDQIATALVAAQASLSLPKKNKEVTVKSDKGSYKFEYTTFDTIIEQVRGPLTKNDLWFVQTLNAANEGLATLTTMLLHKSGQWISSTVRVPGSGRMQEFGSQLTYLKRYSLASMLGIASEEDDDANVADGNSIEDRKERQISPYTSGKSKTGNGSTDTRLTVGQWKTTAIATIKSLKTHRDLNAWEDANKVELDRLNSTSRTAWEDIITALSDQAEKLNPLNAG